MNMPAPASPQVDDNGGLPNDVVIALVAFLLGLVLFTLIWLWVTA